MATRISNNVTLQHADAERASRLLADYASSLAEHAKRTRSEPVRFAGREKAAEARRLAHAIGAGLYTWEEAKP